jgi:hypothetical protein
MEKNYILAISIFLYYLFLTLFDFLATMDINLLKRVQKVMHNNIVSPKYLNVVFRMIYCVIKKRLTVQLVV